jgi:hypothetical protein
MFRGLCNSYPEVDFFWAPPTPRLIPIWLQPSQHIILKLIEAEVRDQQTRIMVLPGFQADPTSLDSDGIHFLSAPGMKYVMHLIDSARFQPNFMSYLVTSASLVI